MNYLETIVRINSPSTITIGRELENEVRKTKFDVSPWVTQFGGEATYAAVYVRPDGVQYPVGAAVEGDKYLSIVWTSTETAVSGAGKLELRAYLDGQLAKSKTFKTVVLTALAEDSEDPPDPPGEGWINKAVEAVSAVVEAAEESAASAAESAELAANSAEAAADSEASAAASAEAAEAAKNSMIFLAFTVDENGHVIMYNTEVLGATNFALTAAGHLEVTI